MDSRALTMSEDMVVVFPLIVGYLELRDVARLHAATKAMRRIPMIQVWTSALGQAERDRELHRALGGARAFLKHRLSLDYLKQMLDGGARAGIKHLSLAVSRGDIETSKIIMARGVCGACCVDGIPMHHEQEALRFCRVLLDSSNSTSSASTSSASTSSASTSSASTSSALTGALHRAVLMGHQSVAMLLWEHGARPDPQRGPHLLLMNAMDSPHPTAMLRFVLRDLTNGSETLTPGLVDALVAALVRCDEECARFLVTAGADIMHSVVDWVVQPRSSSGELLRRLRSGVAERTQVTSL